MAMTTRALLAQINQVKATLKAGGSEALGDKLAQAMAEFKATWSPEEFKAALEADVEIPSGLEEVMTTLYMSWMKERGS